MLVKLAYTFTQEPTVYVKDNMQQAGHYFAMMTERLAAHYLEYIATY